MADKEFAAIVSRRTPTFPSRVASYWDCTPWGGGYVRLHRHGPPGAVVLNTTTGKVLNIRTGEVYTDTRFIDPPKC